MNRLVLMVAPLLGVSYAMGDPPNPGEPLQIVDALGFLSSFVRSNEYDGKFCQRDESEQITPGLFLSEYFLLECGNDTPHASAESALSAGPDTGSFHLSQSSHALTQSDGQPDIADGTAEAVTEIDLELEYATEVDITWVLDANGDAFAFVQLFDSESSSALMQQVSADGDLEQVAGSTTLWMEAGAWTLSLFTSSHAGSPNAWSSPDSTAAVNLLMEVAVQGPVGDLNGDLFVDGADLAIMLGQWGVCERECIADLNDSGDVSGADLSLLLGAWSSL